MILICKDGVTATDAVDEFIKKYVVDKANEGDDDKSIVSVSGEFIVGLAPLYTPDEKPIFDNEYVDIDMDDVCHWQYGWDRGQKIVIISGITPIEEVKPFWDLTKWGETDEE